MSKRIRVAVCCSILYRFREPIFRRLSKNPSFITKYFVGERGSMAVEHHPSGNKNKLNLITMFTVGLTVQNGGRAVPLTFNPTLLFHLIKFNPDVLLIQGGELPNNIVIYLYARLFRKKIVWWSLGEVKGRRYTKPAQIYRKFVQFIERRCDVYLGYSSRSGEYFLSQGYDSSKIFNLVNVVDTDRVKSLIPIDKKLVKSLKTKMRIENEIVLLFVGNITKTKGLSLLVKALFNLSNYTFHLVIVGDGSDRKNVEGLVEYKHLKEKISFVGSIYKNVGSYFELADLLIMPGTGGLVISEGMTHGLPVICSTGDGSEADLVKENINGYIVPPNDLLALTSKIEYFFKKPERLKEMGGNSLKIIDQEHNIESYMNTMFHAIFSAYKPINTK